MSWAKLLFPELLALGNEEFGSQYPELAEKVERAFDYFGKTAQKFIAT